MIHLKKLGTLRKPSTPIFRRNSYPYIDFLEESTDLSSHNDKSETHNFSFNKTLFKLTY